MCHTYKSIFKSHNDFHDVKPWYLLTQRKLSDIACLSYVYYGQSKATVWGPGIDVDGVTAIGKGIREGQWSFFDLKSEEEVWTEVWGEC